jgi:transglutaminase-like putative cysteine protease
MTQTIWLKLLNKDSFYTGLFFLSVTAAAAQGNYEDYKQQYPDYNELILNNSTSYSIDIVDKKLKVIQDNQYDSMILSENGIQNNKESFSYSELVRLISFNAYTVIQEKGKEKKIKVTQALEKMNSDGSVFYDDVRTKQLVFPNLQAGAKKVYEYSTEFVDPNLMHKFIFGDINSVKNSTLKIKTDKAVHIGYEIFNDPNSLIRFSKTENKDSFTYQWTLLDSKPIKYEPNTPGILYSIPHIVFYIQDYSIDDSKIEVLGNVDRIYNYFSGFVKDLNATDDEALRELTLSVTKDKKTDEDKLKAIYYWVKDNIKYIAFENGYGGFIPREASLVFNRKFGDCKDMASIITSMSKYANIPDVYLAWIGTRNIPYSFSKVASPSTTDHMIAVYQKGSEYIFLDATDQETQYGMPSAFIQDKEAMLYKGAMAHHIVKVPVTNANKNLIKDTVIFTIENEKIVGNGHLEVNGYNRTNTLSQIGDASNKTRFEMIKSLVLKGNNKFNLNDYCEENLKERDKPYEVLYDFDIANYAVKVDKELYVNLFFDKYYEKSTLEKDRQANYDFDYLTKFNADVECVVPKNYSVTYVPKNFEMENDLIKVNIQYRKKSNSIQLVSTIEIKKLMLEKKDFALWDETVKKLKSNYSDTIVLQEKAPKK